MRWERSATSPDIRGSKPMFHPSRFPKREMAARKLSANRLSLDIGVPSDRREMGGAKRYPSIAICGDDGFREGLNPSYELKRNIVVDEAPLWGWRQSRRRQGNISYNEKVQNVFAVHEHDLATL
jgi:hypothetical protein